MQVYTELISPTAIAHAVSLPFTQAKVLELVVAKTNLIQIFELRSPQYDVSTQHQRLENGYSHDGQRDLGKRLYLIGEYHLSGTITSLAAVKTQNTKSGGDALLISFRDAKVSLVEWNPETYGLTTISVHYYETENLIGSPWAPELRDCPSFLIVDPNSRCSALRFGLRHLAILPFRQASDELTLGDYDPDLDEPLEPRRTADAAAPTANKDTPYSASFVLVLTELDASVIHVEDLAFLHEYREPTLGILSSANSPSQSIAQDRKDCYTYTAFTLDLQQRASTALISASGLPSDLFKVTPLPLPVGGSLLTGNNELVHIDQAGKAHAVAVNAFASKASAFSMQDQSDLGLRLEGSHVAQINKSGDVLLVLNNGDFVFIKFRIDGRSVSGFSVRCIANDKGSLLLGAAASCSASLGPETIFIGSEQADSLLLHAQGSRATVSRKRSHAEMLGTPDGASDEEVDDEDDLYGDIVPLAKVESQQGVSSSSDESHYALLDRLPNLTSSGEPVLGKRRKLDASPESRSGSGQSELVMATGCGTSSSVAFMKRDIAFSGARELSNVDGQSIWAFATSTQPDPQRPDEYTKAEHTNLIITSRSSLEGGDVSKVFRVNHTEVMEQTSAEFETGVSTVNAGLLHNGRKIIQVSAGEVRSYALDLSYPQIFPMMDESGETELKVQHSAILDPYVLLIRDDASCSILFADKKGELDEVEHGDFVRDTKWSSGCLHRASDAAIFAFLLSSDGALHIFQLPDLEGSPRYSIENMSLLALNIGPDFHYRRSAYREKLTEILVAQLGNNEIHETHLILRTDSNGIAIYKPYYHPSQSEASFTSNLRFIKVADYAGSEDPVSEDDDEEEGEEIKAVLPRQKPMKPLPDIDGYHAVLIPGSAPSLILQEPSSAPHILPIHDGINMDLSTFNTPACTQGLVFSNGTRTAHLAHLPSDTRYDVGWAVRRLPQHQHVEYLCYHAASDLYVVCINDTTDFKLPDDEDGHQEFSKEDNPFRPQTTAGKVRLVDGTSGNIIHETLVEADEVILCTKVIALEVSEITHERKPMIVVGTAVMRGEDHPSNGGIYVYDIIRVVPEPERPESDRALKLVSREEVKGAVTCLTDISDDGFVLAAQGQKLMVRGLKEDGTMLPVAFMDVNVQVTTLKSVTGTGITLMGDALNGIWLLGYSPDPYRMRLFGKSRGTLEVVAAEFLPYRRQLFAFVMDTECNLHIFEYNPEDPASLSGQRLLTRSIFHTGHFASAMISAPTRSTRSHTSMNGNAALTNGVDTNGDTTHHASSETSHSILLTTESGAVALISPLDEQAYRRLGALTNYLNTILDHPCGLNARAYRAADSEGGRGVLDGSILMRWNMLSAPRKADACARVGSSVWEIGRDLKGLCGGEMDHF